MTELNRKENKNLQAHDRLRPNSAKRYQVKANQRTTSKQRIAIHGWKPLRGPSDLKQKFRLLMIPPFDDSTTPPMYHPTIPRPFDDSTIVCTSEMNKFNGLYHSTTTILLHHDTIRLFDDDEQTIPGSTIPFDDSTIRRRRFDYSTNVPFDESAIRRFHHCTTVPFNYSMRHCTIRRSDYSTIRLFDHDDSTIPPLHHKTETEKYFLTDTKTKNNLQLKTKLKLKLFVKGKRNSN